VLFEGHSAVARCWSRISEIEDSAERRLMSAASKSQQSMAAKSSAARADRTQRRRLRSIRRYHGIPRGRDALMPEKGRRAMQVREASPSFTEGHGRFARLSTTEAGDGLVESFGIRR
jgi:hypothetical protein